MPLCFVCTSPHLHHQNMTSPRPPKDPKDKWWNEEPLEGSWHRPAVFITKVLSKSPLLIGWDDERFERLANEARPKKKDCEQEEEVDEEPTKLRIGPRKEVVNKVAFGLFGIATKEVTKHLLHLELQNDDSADDELADFDGNTEIEQEEIDKMIQAENTDEKEESEKESFEKESFDTSSMKETELYQLALRNLRWQRDNYLVGTDYADLRRRQERRRRERMRRSPAAASLYAARYPSFSLPYDPAAMGNQQIVSLFSWFIPSPTVHNVALPMVVSLPTGPLHDRLLRATTDLIPLSQNNLNSVVNTQLLWFLRDEEKKKFIKESTRGYILQAYRNNARR